jgi:hypothetical protein
LISLLADYDCLDTLDAAQTVRCDYSVAANLRPRPSFYLGSVPGGSTNAKGRNGETYGEFRRQSV